ncbi:tail fiber protein [Mucilaginibacter paludis]|uniref:Uncharacterized protein n=1 Tax=Mucilaginibacter paludis DSM 18603 TaxID=714943 RepID=H1YCW9_9SPHI|nr:tail fiber protein [Mucilaginibacter paludis]EHQ25140.1 hypothetical protein Mucpa_0965 [Mucilaginibacter paludis DSM 18603]
MKKIASIVIVLFILTVSKVSFAQYFASFTVQGDGDKFYPVVFTDVYWANDKATELEIGRSSVHLDATWRGSMIAKFRFHVTSWGNGSNFIDADIQQNNQVTNTAFIAGWMDCSTSSNNQVIVIWIKGGSTTYYVNAPANPNVTVYDGIQNALPYQQTNGPTYSYKTDLDSYVNSHGASMGGTAFFNGTTNNNYFAGNVGIGTAVPDEKLTVKGTIHAQSVKVDLNGPLADYVFNDDYKLTSLNNLYIYLKENHHLPNVPSAEQAAKEGLDLGKMNQLLLQKVEELTLYLIQKDKQLQKQNATITTQQSTSKKQQAQINQLIKKVNSLSSIQQK